MTPSLRRLARLYAVQTTYDDFSNVRRNASVDAVLATLRILGAPVATAADAPEAIRAHTQQRWRRMIEPVVVVGPHQQASVEVRLPVTGASGRAHCSLRLENGTEHRWALDMARDATARSQGVDGVRYLSRRVALPRRLPAGYHDLVIERSGVRQHCRVIAAPTRAFSSTTPEWGVFLPLYGLHSRASWGGGNFSDLERLQDWVGRQGGHFVSVLPLLAAHAQAPFDPSPYAPTSRLFWNEFYIDPQRVPELGECPAAQQLLASSSFRRELAALRKAPTVDYDRQRKVQRRVLAELAARLSGSRNARHAELMRYAAEHPAVDSYAAFAAVVDERQTPWHDWPEHLRGGTIRRTDRDQARYFYHLYVQWLAEQQLAAAASTSSGKPGLHLDFPLGVHADGYDTWRYRDAFALDAGGGAPPDPVFTRGQDWQFPPLHPERIRAQGYGYVIDCLKHQMGHASSLRIDHVMALHRLYWIPKGFPASEGVYVGYRSEELYAILCLESHRQRTTLVGENLGTVPPAVNTALSRHGIRKMYVVQYEAQPAAARPLRRVPADSVASVNTHDMPPFAAYLGGLDLQDRLALGLLTQPQLPREQRARQRTRRALAGLFRRNGRLDSSLAPDPGLTRASLVWLAKSAAAAVIINLEDLWVETAPQNVPGTGLERPNWRRKSRYALEELTTRPDLLETIRLVAEARKPRERRRR